MYIVSDMHLMSAPEGNSFVFPRVSLFPENKTNSRGSSHLAFYYIAEKHSFYTCISSQKVKNIKSRNECSVSCCLLCIFSLYFISTQLPKFLVYKLARFIQPFCLLMFLAGRSGQQYFTYCPKYALHLFVTLAGPV